MNVIKSYVSKDNNLANILKQDAIAIDCEKEEEAICLELLLHRLGYTWQSGASLNSKHIYLKSFDNNIYVIRKEAKKVSHCPKLIHDINCYKYKEVYL